MRRETGSGGGESVAFVPTDMTSCGAPPCPAGNAAVGMAWRHVDADVLVKK
jgi:tartrate dehydratase alpha subunit/fumarate hydratase class I-like protein